MLGMVLVRCRLCEELSFDPRTGACIEAGCSWKGDCFMCGSPVSDPTHDSYCSPGCRGDALEEEAAELSRDL